MGMNDLHLMVPSWNQETTSEASVTLSAWRNFRQLFKFVRISHGFFYGQSVQQWLYKSSSANTPITDIDLLLMKVTCPPSELESVKNNYSSDMSAAVSLYVH